MINTIIFMYYNKKSKISIAQNNNNKIKEKYLLICNYSQNSFPIQYTLPQSVTRQYTQNSFSIQYTLPQNVTRYWGRRSWINQLQHQHVGHYTISFDEIKKNEKGLYVLTEEIKLNAMYRTLFHVTKNKHIENNITCPITYEVINCNQEYVSCGTCKYNFEIINAIIKYWINSKKHLCPICKSSWKDYCKYINVEEKYVQMSQID